MNGPPLEPLLEAAEYHLSQRNFDSCRSYALRALKSAPNHTGATQILAVSDTLAASATRISETLPDWYAILQIYRYSQDSNLIRDQAKKLSLLLHENKFPFADEAFKLVHGAWSVLSNPFQKAQFDNELQMFEFKLNETFWTLCPYCYCMYEYLRVYEDCCLRCQNKRCGRGFHAVAVKSPPLEVVEKGQYTCMGFFRLGFDGGERKGVSSWNPFSPMVRVNENVKKNNDGAGVGNECNSENFVELSDESNDSNYGFVRKNVGTYVNDNGEVVETRVMQQKAVGVGRPVVKRMKKSVPRNAKKFMGKGSRIGKMETVAQSAERLNLNAEAGVDDADGGNGNVNANELGGVGADVGNGPDFNTSGVELFAGDDDIFTEDEDANKEYVEETNWDAVMIVAAKLVAIDAVPKEYLGPEIISHFVMHGTSVAEIVRHLIVVLKKKDDDVSYIFLEALKRAYRRHLVVLSNSNYEEDLSVKSFQECKDLAARLSGTFVGAARSKHRADILKIVKDGIEFAFLDSPK